MPMAAAAAAAAVASPASATTGQCSTRWGNPTPPKDSLYAAVYCPAGKVVVGTKVMGGYILDHLTVYCNMLGSGLTGATAMEFGGSGGNALVSAKSVVMSS
jgi:hypothetical protein